MPGGCGGKITIDGTVFEYSESQIGNGRSRGIKISLEGTQNSSSEYKFNPNPHLNPWYNKNQPEFYHEAATRIPETWKKNNGIFPWYGYKITINNTEYKLVD